MFYLLEDNRIIDSRIPYTSNFPYWEVKDNRLYAKSKNDKIVRPCNENEIKKQSENVFDLIEVGDLVKFRYGKIIELCDFQDNANNFVNYLKDCLPEKILAIYKPDANGNYIKVWEKKDE